MHYYTLLRFLNTHIHTAVQIGMSPMYNIAANTTHIQNARSKQASQIHMHKEIPLGTYLSA